MSTFGETTTQSQTPASSTGRPPLRRAYEGRLLAGVCAGIADYLAVDVTIVRVAFAVFTFLGGAGIPAYLACLLLIPEEGREQSIAGELLDTVRLSPPDAPPLPPARPMEETRPRRAR